MNGSSQALPSFVGSMHGGELMIASQRQVNQAPGAGWLVQVVATAVVREERFIVRTPKANHSLR